MFLRLAGQNNNSDDDNDDELTLLMLLRLAGQNNNDLDAAACLGRRRWAEGEATAAVATVCRMAAEDDAVARRRVRSISCCRVSMWKGKVERRSGKKSGGSGIGGRSGRWKWKVK